MSTLSFSAPVEHERARDILQDAVPDLGYPYLMARLGHHSPGAGHQSDRADGSRALERPIDDQGSRNSYHIPTDQARA